MRIGVLVCDDVAERYLPIAGDYGAMFMAMVAAADPAAEVVRFDAHHGELPARPDECDAWLCTGSSASVYDDAAWIRELSAFVREVHAAHVPFVGICFGHQLLAHALGGRTERAAVGWGVGALAMEVTTLQPWMTPALASVTLLYSHQDQVTLLPSDGEVLGVAAHCPVAMMAVGEHMVGIQAHPEFGASYVRALLEDRVDRIGVARTNEAVASLDAPTDERAVADWIMAFVRAAGATGPR